MIVELEANIQMTVAGVPV